MLAWQRRARLAVAAVGILCAAAVFVTVRRREPAPKPVALPQADPRAVVESTGTTVRQVKGETEHFRLEADRQLTYPGGATKLIGVKVGVERDGRTFTITGREAEVGRDQSSLSLQGDVRVVASDGLSVDTDTASFNGTEGIVRAPGRVVFARGRLRGEGIGMTYDRQRELLSILQQAVITLAPDADGAGAAQITAGLAELDRREHYVRLEGAAQVLRAGRLTQADGAVAHLTEDDSRMTSMELHGNARISTENPPEGAVRLMTASDMNLAYAADGEHLERALLSGDATVAIAGGGRGGDRRLGAVMVDVGLAPDGATVLSLVGRDRVTFDVPAEAGSPGRSIRANAMDGSGEPERGLTAVTFTDSVEFRESGGRPPANRLVRARVLKAALGAGLGDIQDAWFSGAVRFDDGTTHGTAAEARYAVRKGVVELSGNVGAASPRVADDRIVVDAARITLTLDGPKMDAAQSVRSVLQAPAGAPGGQGSQPRMPGLMRQDQPVYVTGDALQYDGATSRAAYSGHVRMWQGDMAVQADLLNLDGRTGDLTASGQVRTALSLVQIDEATKARTPIASIASARDLRYEDTLRKATYRDEAHVDGPQGDLRARTIELYLGETGNELERVEGYDDMVLRQNARTVTGTRLTYFASDERYVAAGSPVKISEECRDTTGRILNFFRTTQRILVDGNEQIRTETKSGSSCPPPGAQ